MSIRTFTKAFALVLGMTFATTSTLAAENQPGSTGSTGSGSSTTSGSGSSSTDSGAAAAPGTSTPSGSGAMGAGGSSETMGSGSPSGSAGASDQGQGASGTTGGGMMGGASDRAQQDSADRPQQDSAGATAKTGDAAGHSDDQTVTGTVAKFAKRSISIKAQDGEATTLKIVPETVVTMNGKTAKHSQIKPGQQVRASYNEQNGEQVAVKIELSGKASGSKAMKGRHAPSGSSGGTGGGMGGPSGMGGAGGADSGSR